MSKVILKVQAQMDMFELNAEDAHTFASNAEPKMQISLQGKQRVPARCMRGWFWSIFFNSPVNVANDGCQRNQDG